MTEFLTICGYILDHYSAHAIIVMVAVLFAYVIRKLYDDLNDKIGKQMSDCQKREAKCQEKLDGLQGRFDAYLIGAANGKGSEEAQKQLPAVRMRQSGPVSDFKTTQRLG